MSDIFISYASEDRPRVKPLVDALQGRGWSVWWDRKIPPGKTWAQVLEKALNGAKCVIVLWSRVSVQSEWVMIEADEAKSRGVLIPVLIDSVTIPLPFRRIQAANLVYWNGLLPHAEFDELAGAIADLLPDSASQSSVATLQDPIAPVVVAPPRLVTPSVRENPKDGLNYVWIPPGSFTMGCSPGDSECRDDERPPHQVTIGKGFWMGQNPVTQEAYQRVMGQNPSRFKGPSLPVENVSWDDAQAYSLGVGSRLPTEAEWEYAARGGSASSRYGAPDDIAWYNGNSGGKTHDVKLKQPNAYGLYDMLGNVWEWTADWYGDYSSSPVSVSDPSGPAHGVQTTLRGGSWLDVPRRARASDRSRYGPGARSVDIGFRCVME